MHAGKLCSPGRAERYPFTVHVAPDVPERLITDRKRIEQIVKNFLSNAFKFTAKGTIRLEITVSRERVICRGAGDNGHNGCLAISVWIRESASR
jgi:signal transduction histidine kinase